MAFTEQDMNKQMEEFAALKEELSRLEAQEKALRTQAGLPESGGEKMDMSKLSPQERSHTRRRSARRPESRGENFFRTSARRGTPGRCATVSSPLSSPKLPLKTGEIIFLFLEIIS